MSEILMGCRHCGKNVVLTCADPIDCILGHAKRNFAYSRDGEFFYNDLRSAMSEAPCDDDGFVTLHRGDSNVAKHSDFVSGMSIIEDLQNVAYDEYSEHAETYLDEVDDEKADELEQIILDWLDQNGGPINFYRVSDIVRVKVHVDTLEQFVVAD